METAPKAKAKTKMPVQTTEPPKKTHILKLSTRRTPKTVDTVSLLFDPVLLFFFCMLTDLQ